MVRKLTSVLICICLLSLAAEAFSGSERPTWQVRGLKNSTIPTFVNEFGFTQLVFEKQVIAWCPVDLGSDGLWELALAIADVGGQGQVSNQRVGVIDLRTKSWVDGPHALTVFVNRWGVANAPNGSLLKYYYLSNQTVRVFDPSTAQDTAVWSVDYTPASLVVWGWDGDTPLIGLRKGGTGNITCAFATSTWNIHRSLDGALVNTFGGGPGLVTLLRTASPDVDALGFLVASGGHSDPSGPGSNTLYCTGVVSVDKSWIQQESLQLPNTTGGIGYTGLQLLSATSAHGPAGTLSTVWYTITNGYWNSSTYYMGATGSVDWTTRLDGDPTGMHTSVAAFDLEGDGVDELLLPIANSMAAALTGWEVRTLETGEVIDTFVGMPLVFLASGPYMQADRNTLFYASGPSLNFLEGDLMTAVLPDGSDDEAGNHSSAMLAVAAAPSPFRSSVTLSWQLEVDAQSLTIHNILGQTVRTFDESTLAGNSTITWDGLDGKGRQVTSGVYFARLVTGDQVATAKLVLLR